MWTLLLAPLALAQELPPPTEPEPTPVGFLVGARAFGAGTIGASAWLTQNNLAVELGLSPRIYVLDEGLRANLLVDVSLRISSSGLLGAFLGAGTTLPIGTWDDYVAMGPMLAHWLDAPWHGVLDLGLAWQPTCRTDIPFFPYVRVEILREVRP